MGIIGPKLSRAMLNELDVRRQLGIPLNSSIAKGPVKAERARRELKRRQREQRRRGPGWDDLCYELQDMILSHLSLADLQNLREAGLGSISIDSRTRLHHVMRTRVQNVKPLWQRWRRPEDERRKFNPVDFTSTVNKLSVVPDSDGIPAGISEMKALRTLEILPAQRNAPRNISSSLKTLPHSLGQLEGLLDLKMNRYAFEKLPECVLKLKMLRRLEIDSNLELRELPHDIGDRLVQLRFLSIRWCRKIKTLPESLLRRLEANIPSRKKTRSPPLRVTKEHITETYLKETITKDKYPELAEYVESGALTGSARIEWAVGANLFEAHLL